MKILDLMEFLGQTLIFLAKFEKRSLEISHLTGIQIFCKNLTIQSNLKDFSSTTEVGAVLPKCPEYYFHHKNLVPQIFFVFIVPKHLMAQI